MPLGVYISDSIYLTRSIALRQKTSKSTKISNELHRILLDFILSYHLEKPEDIIEHGYNHFSKLTSCLSEKRRREKLNSSTSNPSIDLNYMKKRRLSIANEKFDPEDDMVDTSYFEYLKTPSQLTMLKECIKDVFIFRFLDPDDLMKVMNAMKDTYVQGGDVVIKQGDDEASFFYVIEKGIFQASILLPSGENKIVKRYENAGSFGELALMYNTPRAATVTALTEGKLWTLDRNIFLRIVLKGAYQKRKQYQELIEKVNYLDKLDNYAKLDLADALVPKYFTDGQEVFHQGDKADGMYFIVSGCIVCIVDHPIHGKVAVTELKPRDYFGELALMTLNPRAMSTVAKGDTKLAFLDKEAFHRLLGPCNEYFENHVNDYKQRLKNMFGIYAPDIYDKKDY